MGRPRRDTYHSSYDELMKVYNKDRYYEDRELGKKAIEILEREFFNEENQTSLTDNQRLILEEVFSRINPVMVVHSIGVIQNCKTLYEQGSDHDLDGNIFDKKTLFLAAALHDVGKSCIPPEILQTTKFFEDDSLEWDIMNKHSVNGSTLMRVIIDCYNNEHGTNISLNNLFDNDKQREMVLEGIDGHHASKIFIKDDDIHLSEDRSFINLIQAADIYNALCDPLRPYQGVKKYDKVIEFNSKEIEDVKLQMKLDGKNGLVPMYSEEIELKMYGDTIKFNNEFEPFLKKEIEGLAHKYFKESENPVLDLFNLKSKGEVNMHFENLEEVKKVTNISFDLV